MKSKLLLFVLAAVLVGCAAPAFAQDQGIPDSVLLVASRPEVGANDSSFVVELYYWGDMQDISGTAFGYHWDNPAIQMDSAVFSAEALAGFDFVKIPYYANNIDSTNDKQLALCILARLFQTGITVSSSRVKLVTYYFSVTSWTGTDMVTFDTATGGEGGSVQIVNDADGGELSPQMMTPLTLRDPSDAGGSNGLDLPTSFALQQNYPNPFNPTTVIEFSLPTRANVKLEIFNLLGQRVRTLRDGDMDAGTYKLSWDATSDGGAKVASGVYFYKLATDNFVDTKKMMLLK